MFAPTGASGPAPPTPDRRDPAGHDGGLERRRRRRDDRADRPAALVPALTRASSRASSCRSPTASAASHDRRSIDTPRPGRGPRPGPSPQALRTAPRSSSSRCSSSTLLAQGCRHDPRRMQRRLHRQRRGRAGRRRPGRPPASSCPTRFPRAMTSAGGMGLAMDLYRLDGRRPPARADPSSLALERGPRSTWSGSSRGAAAARDHARPERGDPAAGRGGRARRGCTTCRASSACASLEGSATRCSQGAAACVGRTSRSSSSTTLLPLCPGAELGARKRSRASSSGLAPRDRPACTTRTASSIRQELSFLDHLMRLISGAPQGRLPPGRLEGRAAPEVSVLDAEA